MTAPTVVAALADALRSDPGRPLVTMYDNRSSDRVELSVATFDNWVCKLANLFGAEWGLESGEQVSVVMAPHWRSMAVAMAAWTCGLTVALDGAPAAAVSLTCWDDFAAEVPAQPDALLLPSLVTATDDALLDASGLSTHAGLVARGRAAAGDLSLAPGGRLLTDLDPVSGSGIDVALLAPLTTGSSVVLLLNATVGRRERVASQERTTCSRWSSA